MANPITDETLMGTFEEKRELVRSFTMFDDTFFSVVMEDKACCEEAIRILTGIQDLTVVKVKTQYSLRNLETHSAVLDVLAEDSKHRIYNIEIQTADDDDHQRRVRYYQANIDISYLNKGADYKDLPEIYMIYMTKFDLFKLGRARCIVRRGIEDSNVVLDNGVHEIYVNAAIKDQTESSELMQFFLGTEATHQQFPKISKRIQYFKEDAEGVEFMCEAVQRYGDQREARGQSKGQQTERMNMIKEAVKMKLPLEAIAQLVRLPSSEVRRLIEQLDGE